MPKSNRSADTTHGAAGRPITKASGATNITPAINCYPTIADMKLADPENAVGTAQDFRGVTDGARPDDDGKILSAPVG